MSLRTTSIPAAAIVCAIWPPMTPAPTTAALKTNMDLLASEDAANAMSTRSKAACRPSGAAECDPARMAESPSLRARELVLLAAASSLLAVAMFWPLVLHLGTQLPRDLGDP